MANLHEPVSTLSAPGWVDQSVLSDSSTSLPNVPLFGSSPKNRVVNDLICFSHLRWNFVYQRPQHLLTRAAQQYRVWYVEEPVWGDASHQEVRAVSESLNVVVPHLPRGIDERTAIRYQRKLIDQLIAQQAITNYIAWYYTPMALSFTDHLCPAFMVYDCMDELSAFLGASSQLLDAEKQLLANANVVFTGGYSLYEAKQKRHPEVYAFPSCIDFDHFAQAKSTSKGEGLPDPVDQQGIAGPRIGYSGVIDERLDLKLLNDLAQQRPDWQFIFLGPIVKIDPATLPQKPNIHYLGMKKYSELPAYFSHWQVAMMPFDINGATRFISPTKTPEFLAAGLPVVSTPIRDVVRTYGDWERVYIADSVAAFEQGIFSMLAKSAGSDEDELNQFLRQQSWDQTWDQMRCIMSDQFVSTTAIR